MEASFRISILWSFPSEKAFIFCSNSGWKEGLEWPCPFFYHPVYKMSLPGCTIIPLGTRMWLWQWDWVWLPEETSPPADCPMLPSSSYRGRKVGCFSLGFSSSWSPNWKYLGCQEQQRITWFFHVNHEIGVVGSTSWWRFSAGLSVR